MKEKIIKYKSELFVGAGGAVGLLIIGGSLIMLAGRTWSTWDEVGKQQARVALVEAGTAKKEKIIQDYQALTEVYKQLSLNLQDEKQFSAILEAINGFARETGVEIGSFYPKDKEDKGWYEQIPLELYVEGKYHQLGRFVNMVEKMEQIVGIERIAFNAENMLDDRLKAVVTINIYLLKATQRRRDAENDITARL